MSTRSTKDVSTQAASAASSAASLAVGRVRGAEMLVDLAEELDRSQ